MATVSTVDAEDVEQTVETVEWSAPDSLGNQHPVRSVRTVTTVHRNREQNTASVGSTARRTVERSAVSANVNQQTNSQTTIKPQRRMRTLLIIAALMAMLALETWLLVRHERKNN